jgi:thiamine biosynthesis protein ThiS
MQLTINGDTKSFPDGLTLSTLVDHLGMKSDRVAIELNHDIVPRPSWPTTELHDGDKLEIVHFVGGGRAALSIQH